MFQNIQCAAHNIERGRANIGAIGEAEINQHGASGKIGGTAARAILVGQLKRPANRRRQSARRWGVSFLTLSQFEQHKAQQSGQAKHGNEEAGFDIAAHKNAFFRRGYCRVGKGGYILSRQAAQYGGLRHKAR